MCEGAENNIRKENFLTLHYTIFQNIFFNTVYYTLETEHRRKRILLGCLLGHYVWAKFH